MAKGYFVSIEGLDGVGKSSLAGKLAEVLRGRGVDTLLTREPGGSPGAEAIRSLIMAGNGSEHGWSVRTEALLFSAARSDHVEQLIAPALAGGKLVICDRFIDSMLAYQCGAGELDDHMAARLPGLLDEDNLPDLTLLLDLEPGHRRIGSDCDRFERRPLAYHQRVRDAYLELARAEPERIIVLDAGQSAETVFQEAMRVITEHMSLSR